MDTNHSNRGKPAEISASMKCRKLENGRFTDADSRVVIEKALPIFVGGEYLITASITPAREKEFVTGYLFGQGLIDNAEEIESISIEENAARVTVREKRKISRRIAMSDYRIVSGGGRAVFYSGMSLPRIRSNMKTGRKEIFRAMNTLFEKAGIYQETEGVHAAGLFTPEAEPICMVEDIGRHNTLDKAIGHALINKTDLSKTFLVSTGRMASEMVTKICRAGIPVAATKTAITAAGLDIGRKCGITIIGYVRDSGTRIHTDMEVRITEEPVMKIYTNAERVTGPDNRRN